MSTYHFGVPVEVIWSTHIILGLYFLYLGYNLLNTIFKNHGVILIIFGSLMSTYHSHLWYLHINKKHE